jgi:hypothetical protein
MLPSGRILQIYFFVDFLQHVDGKHNRLAPLCLDEFVKITFAAGSYHCLKSTFGIAFAHGVGNQPTYPAGVFSTVNAVCTGHFRHRTFYETVLATPAFLTAPLEFPTIFLHAYRYLQLCPDKAIFFATTQVYSL